MRIYPCPDLNLCQKKGLRTLIHFRRQILRVLLQISKYNEYDILRCHFCVSNVSPRPGPALWHFRLLSHRHSREWVWVNADKTTVIFTYLHDIWNRRNTAHKWRYYLGGIKVTTTCCRSKKNALINKYMAQLPLITSAFNIDFHCLTQ